MQYRRSRTDMPRASPFNVRSSMKITLLTVVYAGLQTALNHRGRVRYPLVCPNPAHPRVFPNGYHAKKITASPPFLAIPRHSSSLHVITWNDKLPPLRNRPPLLLMLA